MKRSVIQIGNRTEVITLPKDWVRKFDLRKGDSVEVTEQGGNLLVIPAKGTSKKITIDLTTANKTAVRQAIISAYQFGYDKVTLKYNPTVIDLWDDNKEIKTRDVVSLACEDLLIGFECVKLEDEHAELRDMVGVSSEEFRVILRRTFKLIQALGWETHRGIKDNDKSLLQFIFNQYQKVRKYIRYCKRYLTKVGEGEKTSAYLDLVSKLEHISVGFRYLIRWPEAEYKEFSKESIDILERIVEVLEDVYEFIYHPTVEMSSQIYKKRREIYGQIEEMTKGNDKYNLIHSQRLIVMLNHILYMTTIAFAVNFEGKKK